MKRNTNSIREDRGTFSYRLIGYIVMSIISILCLIPFWLNVSGAKAPKVNFPYKELHSLKEIL